MNKGTSFYLDLLRVIAAFGVVMVHANLPLFSNGLFLREQMGHKLVMVFFVLSGYLIAFTVSKKNKGSHRYLVDRFSRLYSVVLPALLFTFVIDFIGKHFNPSAYLNQIAPDHQIFRFILNATFTQQIWGFCTKPSSNGPFWSISYEFWYYILFWAFCYLTGTKRYIGIIILSLFIGPKILLLFPVWIFGVLAYNYSYKITMGVRSATMLFIATLVLVCILSFLWDFSFFEDKFVFGSAPLYFSSRFVFDWVYGALVAVNLFCLNTVSESINIPAGIESVIKYLSSITFSLYLFHLPVLIFMGAIIPYNKSSYVQTITLLGTVLTIVALLALLTEKQRDHWKELFSNVFRSVPD
jgi:peptidoglycan/LPS O-acetylase OafA/YrhL